MDLETKFIELLNKIEEFAVDEGYQLALDAVRVEAVSNVVIGLVWLMIGCICINKVIKYIHDDEYDFDKIRYGLPTILIIPGSFFGILVPFIIFTDVWLYTALIRPELYIVQRILGL